MGSKTVKKSDKVSTAMNAALTALMAPVLLPPYMAYKLGKLTLGQAQRGVELLKRNMYRPPNPKRASDYTELAAMGLLGSVPGGPVSKEAANTVSLIKVDAIPKLWKKLMLQRSEAGVPILKGALKSPQRMYKVTERISPVRGMSSLSGVTQWGPKGSRITIGSRRVSGVAKKSSPRYGERTIRTEEDILPHEFVHSLQKTHVIPEYEALSTLADEVWGKFGYPKYTIANHNQFMNYWVNSPNELHADFLSKALIKRPINKPLTKKAFDRLDKSIAKKAIEITKKRLQGRLPWAKVHPNYLSATPQSTIRLGGPK